MERAAIPFGVCHSKQGAFIGWFQQKGGPFLKKRYIYPHAGKYTFEGYLSVNEKTNALKVKKGNVSNFTKNIEANKSIYNEGPA